LRAFEMVAPAICRRFCFLGVLQLRLSEHRQEGLCRLFSYDLRELNDRGVGAEKCRRDAGATGGDSES